MKILVGSFQCESNTFCSVKAKKTDFEIIRGDRVLEKLVAAKYFAEQGFEVIPMIFASALPSGKVEKQSYLDILSEFLDIIKDNLDAAGIYLYLHGSMYADDIGSGEEYMINQIRGIVGNKMPISLALDFHANNSRGLVQSINAISGFRTAPHIDHDQTELRAANALARIILEKIDAKTYMVKIPIMLADAAVTTKEPYKSIVSMLDELDNREDVIACSVFNGQPWVDADFMGGSITASYSGNGNGIEVKKIVDKIANTLWQRRNEFSFDVPAKIAAEALELAEKLDKPVYITDSGDNTTAGAEGKSTYFLSEIFKTQLKRVLVCGISCDEIVNSYYEEEIGTQIGYEITATDIYSNNIRIEGILKAKGEVLGWAGEISGKAITVKVGEIDIVFTDVRAAFISREHINKMNIRLEEYEYVILKMGYLFPKLKPLAKSVIFALTPGTSTNAFDTLEFKELREEYFTIR